ncbi:YafY family transcriptional regulator [Rhodobacteraceae bacterium CCMM004]|nr:YafY family transcriptional regulator [Rhodobacteraceae bacterium CCMM004]
MRRADRLFRIVQYLRGGRLITAKALAERLEVSQRTVYRDIADLQASGVPVEGEAGVGYVMQAGYDLPPLMFTRDEIAALTAGARLIRAWGGASMARAAEEALIKVAAVLPEAVQRAAGRVEIHAFASEMTDALRDRLDTLEGAVEARRVLTLDYRRADGAESLRRVHPLGLWFWGKVWTLVAWCELRGDYRMFRVDRISGMTVEEDRFRPVRGRTLADFYRRCEAEGAPPLPR